MGFFECQDDSWLGTYGLWWRICRNVSINIKSVYNVNYTRNVLFIWSESRENENFSVDTYGVYHL